MDNQDPIIITPQSPPKAGKNQSARQRTFRWLREYFFQFFMLFLAVAAGFFADDLRDDFGEKRQTRDYANSILSDLRRDSSNVKFQLSILASTIYSIDSLADYVRGKKLDELDNLTLYRFTRISPNPAFRWSRATLQQIKSSGSLRNFSNDGISNGISYYDALTLHLDQDNFEDQERYHDATTALSRVVNLNYPIDNKTPPGPRTEPVTLTLITHDMQDVDIMMNVYLIARNRNAERAIELRDVLLRQQRLIKLLKEEYKLR